MRQQSSKFWRDKRRFWLNQNWLRGERNQYTLYKNNSNRYSLNNRLEKNGNSLLSIRNRSKSTSENDHYGYEREQIKSSSEPRRKKSKVSKVEKVAMSLKSTLEATRANYGEANSANRLGGEELIQNKSALAALYDQKFVNEKGDLVKFRKVLKRLHRRGGNIKKMMHQSGPNITHFSTITDGKHGKMEEQYWARGMDRAARDM